MRPSKETSHPMRRRGRAGWWLIVMLAAITIMSQFFRASGGVIAPELVRELDLSPEMLGFVNGSFFIAIGMAQIPVGTLFDRIGARRTITALTAVAVAGSLLHAAATSGALLVTARLLLGLGCAGSFMGAVVLCSRWHGGDRLSTVLSWVFALSQIGILLAATPLALISELAGWRWAFVAAAAGTAAIGTLFYRTVRDDPPDRPVEHREPEPPRAILRGLLQVWRSPGLLNVLAIHAFAYASMVTVLGLWAAPYLHDVHGLDTVARGNVLLAMGMAQVVGVLCFGPLDRIFNTRKWVVVSGASATIAVLAALAAIPQPPLWLAVGLLVLLCGVAAYSTVIVAHGRSLFPAHLAGRGVTTVNIAQVAGCAFLPIATGAIAGAFPEAATGSPETGYRLIFGFIALALASGLAVYLGARDARPRPALPSLARFRNRRHPSDAFGKEEKANAATATEL